MTATHHDDQKHNLAKFVLMSRIWRFLKSTPLVVHVFIAVTVMVYLVAVMVSGPHGIGPSGPTICGK